MTGLPHRIGCLNPVRPTWKMKICLQFPCKAERKARSDRLHQPLPFVMQPAQLRTIQNQHTLQRRNQFRLTPIPHHLARRVELQQLHTGIPEARTVPLPVASTMFPFGSNWNMA